MSLRAIRHPGVVDFFFSSFEKIVVSEEDIITSIGQQVPIPSFQARDIHKLLECALERFQMQTTVLQVATPVCVVGDIHGNLQDLVRILRECRLESSYLFLGDYVDRGNFSLECILFLLALACKYPERFALIRGNHETKPISSTYGFRLDIVSMYGEELFEDFIELFAWMPLAAIIDDRVFCVHGGIGPALRSVDQIDGLVRPLFADANDELVQTLLWADPNPNIVAFGEGGRGVEFGPLALRRFLRENGLEFVLRGHQCVDGVQFMTPNRMQLATVFSSSNYSVKKATRCGVVHVLENGQIHKQIWDNRVQAVARADVSFSNQTREEPVGAALRGTSSVTTLNVMVPTSASQTRLLQLAGVKGRMSLVGNQLILRPRIPHAMSFNPRAPKSIFTESPDDEL